MFLKGTIYGYLYCENRGLERLPDNVGGIRFKSQSLMQKTCLSGASETLPACVGFMPTYIGF